MRPACLVGVSPAAAVVTFRNRILAGGLVLPATGLAAACAARKVTIWRLYLPLEGVARPLRGPIAFVGDPNVPKSNPKRKLAPL